MQLSLGNATVERGNIVEIPITVDQMENGCMGASIAMQFPPSWQFLDFDLGDVLLNAIDSDFGKGLVNANVPGWVYFSSSPVNGYVDLNDPGGTLFVAKFNVPINAEVGNQQVRIERYWSGSYQTQTWINDDYGQRYNGGPDDDDPTLPVFATVTVTGIDPIPPDPPPPPNPVLSMPSGLAIDRGGTIDMPILVNVPNLMGAQFGVAYDKDALIVESVTLDADMPIDWHIMANIEDDIGQIGISISGETFPLALDGPICTIRFTAKDDATLGETAVIIEKPGANNVLTDTRIDTCDVAGYPTGPVDLSALLPMSCDITVT